MKILWELQSKRIIETPTKHIKKGTILQHQGERYYKSYIVKKGLLKSYTIDEKGKEHIFMFAPENWIIGDIESREFNVPTQLFIEAIEDSEVITIKEEERINEMSQEEAKENIKLLFRRVGVLQQRVIMLMSATALERYQHFLKMYPQLMNRVPQKMIASYLGVTPEALSAIRGKLAKQK